MEKFTNYLRKTGFTALCAILLGYTANATTYTAVVSGNFNASTTWGGVIPGSLLSSDIVIIPSGITVTLTSDETFNGSSSLIVNGTLSSGTSALVMTSGSLAGNGTITVDSMALGLTSGIVYTGSITAQKFTSTGAYISTAVNVTVGATLRLTSGTLNFIAGSLTMSGGSTIEVSGGNMTVSGGASLNLTNPYHVSYISLSATTGPELSGSGLTNVSINVPGSVTLSSDLNMKGMLTLTAGTLVLNNMSLVLSGNADFNATGSGNISSSAGSNITISSGINFTGGIRFAASGNMVNNLTINMTNANSTVRLGSNLTVIGQLGLQSGKINIGSNNLSIAATGAISGGSTNSYVITNGMGSLIIHLLAGSADTFAIGTQLHYAPAIITANSGSASGDVGVTVNDSVYAHGTNGMVLSSTQSVVSATWYVTSTATSGINYNMQLIWSSSMEVNSFNRVNAYISHYTSGAWDASAASSASIYAGGMYSLSRSGITSLSPFTVADMNANMTHVNTLAATNNKVIIYPNPVTGTLQFTSTAAIKGVSIYDINGHFIKGCDIINGNNSISMQELPTGFYYAYFLGQDNSRVVEKFIKE